MSQGHRSQGHRSQVTGQSLDLTVLNTGPHQHRIVETWPGHFKSELKHNSHVDDELNGEIMI